MTRNTASPSTERRRIGASPGPSEIRCGQPTPVRPLSAAWKIWTSDATWPSSALPTTILVDRPAHPRLGMARNRHAWSPAVLQMEPGGQGLPLGRAHPTLAIRGKLPPTAYQLIEATGRHGGLHSRLETVKGHPRDVPPKVHPVRHAADGWRHARHLGAGRGHDVASSRPPPTSDAGTVRPTAASPIPWPEEELQPLTTLEGPALLAAHTVLQQVLQRFPKSSQGACVYSPQALEVVVGQQGGWYFVRVNRRVDKCPGHGPGTTLQMDWFELHAVSPEGRVERYPYHP